MPTLHFKRDFPMVIFFLASIIIGGGVVYFTTSKSTVSEDNIDNFDYFKSGLSSCFNENDELTKLKCFKNFADDITQKFSFKEIVSYFDNVQDEYQCHDAMHFVANSQYKKGTSLRDVYKTCTSACLNACYHGGLEGYFIKNNLGSADTDAINTLLGTLCDGIDADSRGQCYHGIGHGLMLITAGDLITSLKFCDFLKDQSGYVECYAGVFMENLPNASTATHFVKRFLKENDPMYPCNILDERYLESCYTFQLSYFNYLAKGDWETVGNYCKQEPKKYQNKCFQRIGSAAPGAIKIPNEYMNICRYKSIDGHRDYCVRGIVDSYLDRYSGDSSRLVGMIDFCNTVSDQYKIVCFDQVRHVLSLALHSQQEVYEKACSKASSVELRSMCLNKLN